MVEHTKVSRKTTNEDRIAICPQLGCKTIRRVKPLKLGFLGFGKYPKCKQHHLPLVYVDERIGEIVDASLACLFDKSGLPPKELLTIVNDRFPKELNSFINSWVYCITIGRGAKIISVYMDTISNSYLKQITKKQLKALKDEKSNVFEAIKKGIDEITIQYERLLKHIRVHSEVFVNTKEILTLTEGLRNATNSWLEASVKEVSEILKVEEKQDIPIAQVKDYYDKILNLDTCRCLLGLSPIEKHFKKRSVSAFDRFSVYYEFWLENLTQKFTKSDIEELYNTTKVSIASNKIPNSFTNDELEFFRRKKIDLSKIKTRWAWVKNKQIAMEFYKEVVLPQFDNVPKAHDLDEIGYRGFRASIRKLGLGVNDLTKAAGFKPYHEEKYTGLNYDELVKFFKENVYPEVKNKLQLKMGEAPGAGDLESKDLGYRGFVDRVRKVSKKEGINKNIWAEFIKQVGLEPKKDLKYHGMDFSELMDLYVKDIYPKIKKVFDLNPGQTPLKEQIKKGHSGFVTALRRKGYNLTDLHLAIGFELNYMAIYNEKSYPELRHFFKNIIQPTLLNVYDYSLNEAPSYEEVEKQYRGFLAAIGRYGKKFSDVVKESGFIVRPSSMLGDLTHRAMNLLLSFFINQSEVPYNYFSEIQLFYPSSKHRIDGLLFVNKKLLNCLNSDVKTYIKAHQFDKKTQDLLNDLVKRINKSSFLLIDFSNGFFKRGKANSELIARKMMKYLDLPNSFLLCVGTNWTENILIRKLPLSVRYKDKNVSTKKTAFISPSLLSVIFGFDFLAKDILNNIISSNIAKKHDELKRIIHSTVIMKNVRIYGTDEFFIRAQKSNLNKWLN